MVMDHKARLQGDEWARIWVYEAERVAREGAQPLQHCYLLLYTFKNRFVA
jgi:hypothetical protein